MTKQKKPSAFMKPVKASAALAQIVGTKPMPRTEVTKNLWDYIKKNKLQDPNNKRMIRPDSKLSAILGKEPIDMFEMTRKVAKHLEEAEHACSSC